MIVLEAGTTLGHRYQLTQRIASGGMGEVWQAQDLSLARKVAIKVLKPEYGGNRDFLMRLRAEARNTAGVSHPNIAQLYDYGEQEGVGFIVMELIKGEPLSAVLERTPVLPPERILPILAQTARGLHAAHVAGVVHRDVKPANILLEHGERVKITDFGVSMAANQIPLTATGMVMGTAQYLSPEQALGKAATAASDVYGLGIVAYESLNGKRPFTGKTPVDIAVAHVNTEVPPLPDSVHPKLARVVMQMLDKEPSKRPRSAIALAAIFDQILDEIGNQNAIKPATTVAPPYAPPLVSPQASPPAQVAPATPPAQVAPAAQAPPVAPVAPVDPVQQAEPVAPAAPAVPVYPSRSARSAVSAASAPSVPSPAPVPNPFTPVHASETTTDVTSGVHRSIDTPAPTAPTVVPGRSPLRTPVPPVTRASSDNFATPTRRSPSRPKPWHEQPKVLAIAIGFLVVLIVLIAWTSGSFGATVAASAIICVPRNMNRSVGQMTPLDTVGRTAVTEVPLALRNSSG